MQALLIIVLSVFAAVCYGIIHDQITARICLEYFTIAHPPMGHFHTATELGFIWGILATWWFGLILGIVLALCARFGERPACTTRQLLLPIFKLLMLMASCALVAACIAYACARFEILYLVDPMAEKIPLAQHHNFIAVLWAHMISYLTALIGGVVLCLRTWRKRGKVVGHEC